MRFAVLLFALPWLLPAEVHDFTLRQTIDRALRQNPDILMARFDELRAVENVQQVRDPFSPKLIVGSGLGYTSGMPMSIGGNVPALIQAQAVQTFYNRQLSYQVAAAKESARGAGIDTAARRDQVAFQVANLHLAAERESTPPHGEIRLHSRSPTCTLRRHVRLASRAWFASNSTASKRSRPAYAPASKKEENCPSKRVRRNCGSRRRDSG